MTNINHKVNLIETLEQAEQIYGGKIDSWGWYRISGHQKLSENFIEKYSDKVDWQYISKYQKLSEQFIEKHSDKVDWQYISMYQKLSEQFIEKYSNRVCWSYFARFHKLSENFIEKHSNKLDWKHISECQKLSENFIEKYSNELDWYCVSKYQKLSKRFIERHLDKLDYETMAKSYHYKTTEAKKLLLQNLNLYECYQDYFIAYKSIRNDRYSHYNFQYQYNIGEVYECFADYSEDENSFGLSAWTLKEAKEFRELDESIIIKVKVYYKDIARIVHNGGKIRCCKFEVLEDVEV